MYLSAIRIEGYKLFEKSTIVSFNKGLNVIVGENGCGKTSIIDAIRLLLNEDEATRNGVVEEDFYSSYDKKIIADKISLKGTFSGLSEDKKIEYLTWLNDKQDAVLNLEIINKYDGRNNLKKKVWGGLSSNSIFEWETLNDIQCVYLPPLRDAERKLRASRGSRLSRLLINLSQEELKKKRKSGETISLEEDVNTFNDSLAKKDDISKANQLINDSLKKALGSVFGQNTKIQFNELSYERIVEALRIVFFPTLLATEESIYRNLFENSLGYNNLIYIATILAEFEGLKEKYSTPRILLIEELEAHLHPQIQIKLLKYLEKQATDNDIQIIITTHSTTIASATSVENIICVNISKEAIVVITPLQKCELEPKAERFINRWLDATKSTLLFSKGVILVEGLAEAILLPKLAEIYLKTHNGKHVPSSLEEAGISVINMNGIYFNYFMQLYRGFSLNLPERDDGESKKDFNERLLEFYRKERFEKGEYQQVEKIPIRCVALTDNDPKPEVNPDIEDKVEGKNSKLYNIAQLENMTDNCRVFTNLKTFEYDMALHVKNVKPMINILLDNLETNGDIRKTLEDYLNKIEKKENFLRPKLAALILSQIDSNYMGKGLFAQLLLDKISDVDKFKVPDYICNAIKFVLDLQEENNNE